MRLTFALAAALALACPLAQLQAAPIEADLQSQPFSFDLPVAESKEAIHQVEFNFRLDVVNGKGFGVLTLDPNSDEFDEFGNLVMRDRKLAKVVLECTLTFVKEDKKLGERLFEIAGPKITSRFALVVVRGAESSYGRLLVRDKNGKVKYVVDLALPPTIPCHPGCFPAGTAVRVPKGTMPIERLRKGDLVITVGADGKPAPCKVVGIFVTRNRLLKVQTNAGVLETTATQPVYLEDGGFRPAGELKLNDTIWRWDGAGRKATAVLEVTAGREAEVFNLVLGDPMVFVVGDFLVRSKPPAVAAVPP